LRGSPTWVRDNVFEPAQASRIPPELGLVSSTTVDQLRAIRDAAAAKRMVVKDFQLMVSPLDGSVQAFDPLKVTKGVSDRDLVPFLRMLDTWIERLDSIATMNGR
jgi:hypothetical protein